MKKILIVVNVDWFFLSHRLSIGIAAKNAGYDVTVAAFDTGRSAEIESHGLNFIHIPFKRSGTNLFKELKCIVKLKYLYFKLKPDLIHHVTLKVAIYGSIATKFSDRKIINAISGLGYNFTAGRKGILQQILRQLMRFSFRNKNSHFIFQNIDDVNVFKGLDIVTNEQISLIKGSGVDLEIFTYSPLLDLAKKRVVLPARMLFDKGVVEFVEAANLLKTKFKGSVEFILAGDLDAENLAGIKESELRELIDGDYIKWVGYQSNMVKLYQESDIVVLPSYREGLPKSLIEAAAIGRPIITTDVPGCRECVIDGVNGYLVPPKDSINLALAIEKMLIDFPLRESMGAQSRELAIREFSIVSNIKQTLNIYNGLLKDVVFA